MGPLDLRESIVKVLREARAELEEVGRGEGGRELSLVITKLQEALFWAKDAKGKARVKENTN